MKKIVAILIIILINSMVVSYAETITPNINIIKKTDEGYCYNGVKIHFSSSGEIENLYWTGKEYILYDEGYKKSTDLTNWEDININFNGVDERIFINHANSFKWCGDKYIVKSTSYERGAWAIVNIIRHNKLPLLNANNPIYVLNNNFEIIGETNFDELVTAFSYVNNKFYVRTQDYLTNCTIENNGYTADKVIGQPINKIYVSDDGVNWSIDERLQEIPLSNNGCNILAFNKGMLEISSYTFSDILVGSNLNNLNQVIFEREPLHIAYKESDKKAYKVANELYVSYQMDNEECFEVSLDGVYWFQIEYPQIESDESLVEYHHLGNKILFRTDRRLFEYNIDEIKQIIIDKCSLETPFVQIDDKILGFEVPPVTESDRTLVPMRFLFEQMGAEVTWNNDTQTATATLAADSVTTDGIQTYGLARGKSITFGIDDTTAVVNGDNAEMDVPARLVDGKTMVPLRFLSENLGYNVEWDENTNTAIVTTK